MPETNRLSGRQRKILALVQSRGFVAIDNLADAFSVTPQTIRRDINELCTRKLLLRYHGGAGLPSSVENIDYSHRQVMALEAKQKIAASVAQHIPDHASLFINLGTTNEEVARALGEHTGLRVITNNLNVAAIMSENEGCEVIIAGGVVRSRDRGVTGVATVQFIEQFKVDFGIVGISGIDVDGTLFDFDFSEVQAAEAIMENSRRVFLVADHSKVGRNALVRLGHLRQIDSFFTDLPLARGLNKVAKAGKTQVVLPSS